MSCLHGNPIGGCDICDEIDAAFEAGRRSGLAEQPANKPWVGLTNDEIYTIDEDDEIDWPAGGTLAFARLIEAKLKEKNI